MENNKKKKYESKFNIAKNIAKTKKWILFSSIVGGAYLVFGVELTVPLIIMLGMAILFFIFDYGVWNIFTHNMENKKFEHWIKVVKKLKNQNGEKNKKKIETKLIISVLLILLSSIVFSCFEPLHVQIFIACILFYMLYCYFAYSITELSLIISDVIEESK